MARRKIERNVTKQSKNDNLHKAKTAKNDEFYTTKESIETELKHYWPHFKDKIIYCNCDDPYESEFFKYFMIRFNLLGLKGLYATCYEGSQVSQHQLQVFDDDDYKGIPYKIEIYQEDIDKLLAENNDTLSQDTIQHYIKSHNKAERLEGNGSFDSPECIELLKKSNILVTNPPFSNFRNFVAMLQEYQKDFIIWGNNNAITYKEVFPLIKENKMWLGYTANKTCVFKMPPSYEKWDEKLTAKYNDGFKYGKVPSISVFTNLDIPKRHEDLIVWKKYSPEEYPHYDNYDAINVDKVAEIPCDYCESWGLYHEEFEVLDKAQWEEVRREPKDDTELIYIIPAKGTELRQALHEHTEGYKEEIEAELANAIYCSGCMGVPITVLDKYNPEQLEIVKFRKGDDEKDLTYTPYADTLNRQPTTDNYALLQNSGSQDIVTESSESLSHSSTSGVQSNSELSDTNTISAETEAKESIMVSLNIKERASTNESLSKRHCNGCMGVPITVLDKYNPEQLEIINPLDYKIDVSIDKPQKDNIIANARMQECKNARMQECKNARMQILAPGADGWHVNGKRKYARIFVRKVL